jgi:hypothetical protein
MREFCVYQCYIVIYGTANMSIGRLGNLLINKDQMLNFAGWALHA